MKEYKNKKTIMVIIDKNVWYRFCQKYPHTAYKRIQDFIRASV